MCGYTPKTLGIHYIAFFSFFVTSPGELGGLLRGARAHHDDRRTLEVPGCSSALCLGFSCCRGRASGELGLLRCRCGCLRPACVLRSSLNHAIEQATSRDEDGRPAAQAEQQQKSRQPRQGSCLAPLPPFWGSTTGLPARGACGSLLFRQDKKRKQLPTKNNVEVRIVVKFYLNLTDLDLCGHAEVRGG